MKSIKVFLALLLMVIMVFVSFSEAEEAKTEVYNWKMISSEPQGMPQCNFAEIFAKLLEEKSDGRIKTVILPYGTIGGMRDQIELVQMGEVEFGVFDYGWMGGFVPQVQVFALNYIWPTKNVKDAVINFYKQGGKGIQLLQEKFNNKGFQLLGLWSEAEMILSSNVPIRSPEDCKGIKMRVMGSPILIADYNNYGFNAISLDYGDVYGALQTHLIDAQVNGINSLLNMGFYEQQKYGAYMKNEYFIVLPVASYNFFNSLSEDLQQIINDAIEEATRQTMVIAEESDKAKKNKIKELKPEFTFYELTDEEILPFKELAWREGGPTDLYSETGGEGAKEILDSLLDYVKNY